MPNGRISIPLVKKITLRNFKQFREYKVSCRENNILVGPNIAGKSTVLDALRIASDVIRFASRKKPHNETFEGQVAASHHLGHSAIRSPVTKIVHNYNDDEAAEIHVELRNGSRLVVLLHPDKTVKSHMISDGSVPSTTTSYKSRFPLNIVSVPTLGPLDENERYLTDQTVLVSENTRLAHRHLRNILIRKSDDDFRDFARLVEEAWPSITLEKPKHSGYENFISMAYFEKRIPREVYWSGFGFQVWMQMMLQFMRGSPNTVLVLDEPDIYLHPDLQRRLMRKARENFGQIFVATHATEIVNDASPGDILLISSEKPTAERITNEYGFRKLFKYIGSSENAEFARLARAKRIVFFEGYDKLILRKFAQKVGATDF